MAEVPPVMTNPYLAGVLAELHKVRSILRELLRHRIDERGRAAGLRIDFHRFRGGEPCDEFLRALLIAGVFVDPQAKAMDVGEPPDCARGRRDSADLAGDGGFLSLLSRSPNAAFHCNMVAACPEPNAAFASAYS